MTLRQLMFRLSQLPTEQLDYSIRSEEGETLYDLITDHPQNIADQAIWLCFSEVCSDPEHTRTNSQGSCRDCSKPHI